MNMKAASFKLNMSIKDLQLIQMKLLIENKLIICALVRIPVLVQIFSLEIL